MPLVTGIVLVLMMISHTFALLSRSSATHCCSSPILRSSFKVSGTRKSIQRLQASFIDKTENHLKKLPPRFTPSPERSNQSDQVEFVLSDNEAASLHKKLRIPTRLTDTRKYTKKEADDKKLVKAKYSSSEKQSNIDAPLKSSMLIRGFLEINPFICTGCGTSFQSKSEAEPGYLPKEIMKEHHKKATLMHERQEAIRILHAASIDLDSDIAEELLRSANKSEEVISGIRQLGKTLRKQEEALLLRQAGGQDINNDDNEVQDDFSENKIETQDVDSNPKDSNKFHFPQLQKILEEEDVTGIIPTPEMVRAVMDRALLPRKYRKTKDDLTGINVTNSATTIADILEANDNNMEEDVPIFKKNDHKSKAICICQRCFRLQVYGTEPTTLRPGWSDVDSLTPERFVELLSVIKSKKAVVLCIVDVFDLKGSLIENLKSIAGNNPIVVAVNKVDLLPKDASLTRVRSWVCEEVRRVCGFKSPKDDSLNATTSSTESESSGELGTLRLGDVHLISCATKRGIGELMNRLNFLASDHGSTVYCMGSANVGKSSFINLLLEYKYKEKGPRPLVKPRKGAKPPRDSSPHATVSPLPGTTLNFLKIKLHNGLTFYDTPGLISPNQITSRLNIDELKYVIPKKSVTAITLRVEAGKCVMIGALASIAMLEGKPFFMTFFVSNEIPIRPMLIDRVPDFIEKHVGIHGLLFPPTTRERFDAMLPMQNHIITIKGDGWLRASTDVAIAGLGWVSFTGVGDCKIAVSVPHDIAIETREALLPFEAAVTHARFTGGRIEQTGRTDKRGFRR